MSHPPHDDWDEHDVRGAGAHDDDDVFGLRGEREHDASLADEMLEPAPAHETFRPRRRQRRSPVLKVLALLLAAAAVVVGGIYSFGAVRSLLPDLSIGSSEPSAADYEGSGTGEILIEIPQGAAGGRVAISGKTCGCASAIRRTPCASRTR